MRNPIAPVGGGFVGQIIQDIVRILERDLRVGPPQRIFSLDDFVPTLRPTEAESSTTTNVKTRLPCPAGRPGQSFAMFFHRISRAKHPTDHLLGERAGKGRIRHSVRASE
jgi:hypothetical protein